MPAGSPSFRDHSAQRDPAGVVASYARSVEAVPEAGEPRVQRGQELLVGKPSPFVAVEGLVARGADTPDHLRRVPDAREHRRHPVRELDPGVRGLVDVGCDRQAVPDLGPEPFGGVAVAALCDVAGAHLCGDLVDPGRLAPARVVLPEPALCGKIAAPPSLHRERAVPLVDGDRARACRVDADADDVGGREPARPPRRGKRAPDARLQGGRVIPGVLARKVRVLGVEKDALAPAPVVGDETPDFGAVAAADDQGASRIRSKIYSEGKCHDVGVDAGDPNLRRA